MPIPGVYQKALSRKEVEEEEEEEEQEEEEEEAIHCLLVQSLSI